MSKKITLILFLLLTSLSSAFSNDTLKIAYCMEPPFVIKSQDGTLSGPSVWLWENIAKENNLEYKYVEMPLEELLQALKNKEIDASLSPLTITAERYKVIKFTSPYHVEHASLLERNISSLQKSWEFVKSFFSINFLRASGALVFVVLVFGLLIWFFERKKNKEEFHHGIKGIWEGFWWSAVTMTTVGYGDKSPKTIGGRVISLIWMFTAIIIISSLTASIASSLTVNNISSSHDKIADFKNTNLGTIEGSATNEWLKKNFFTKKKEFATIEEALNALDKKEIDAIAYDRALLKSVIKKDTLLKYQFIDIKYNPQFFAFGFSKKLPDTLIRKINYSMLSNIEKMDWKVQLSENGVK
ncbi:MAG: ABC transporter substrate-binding protein [Draconibacterium sp.]|nr:MAG: ABC transporter substrate-binding protein [Draconibacterium sp.]